jgi:hypothetical protein
MPSNLRSAPVGRRPQLKRDQRANVSAGVGAAPRGSVVVTSATLDVGLHKPAPRSISQE